MTTIPKLTSSPAGPDPRLAIVIHRLEGGGAEHVARVWAEHLHHQGVDVTIYLKNPLSSDLTPAPGIRIRTNPGWASRMGGALYPIWLRSRLRDDCRNVVLSLLPYSAVVSHLATLGLRTKISVIASERNLPDYRPPVRSLRRTLRMHALMLAARQAYRSADAVIAPSHPVAASVAATYNLPHSSVFVVPNPAAPSFVPPPKRDGGTSRLNRIAFVGRLNHDKRPHLFLDVIAELQRRLTQVTAVVIGDGPLRASLESRAVSEQLPVEFAGWKRQWWTDADDIACLLMTSPSEGFGNVLVEAAAAGIPVVASSRALSVADAVVPGLTGELTVTDDPTTFADAIARVVHRDWPEPDAIRPWLDRFSPTASADSVVRVVHFVRNSAEYRQTRT